MESLAAYGSGEGNTIRHYTAGQKMPGKNKKKKCKRKK